MNPQPHSGRLVVATPTLADPNFEHTVVLLIEHGEDGSLGVVVNRPSEVAVADVLSGWSALVAQPANVFVGGPVQRNALLAVGAVGQESDTVQLIAEGLGVIDLHADPDDLQASVDRIRLFAGYAGWSPGQLEAEIEAGGWFVIEGRPDDVFAGEPEQLWRRVLIRQGGFFRTIPDDPSLN